MTMPPSPRDPASGLETGQGCAPTGRFAEIDLLRGGAVLAMVVSNFLFDLSFFLGMTPIPVGAADVLARVTAGTFLGIAGVSLVLRRRRTRGNPRPFVVFFRRAAVLVAFGMLVSGATWVAAGDQLVVFGVLHCIGVTTMLAYPLLRLPWLAGIFGFALLCGQPFLALLPAAGPWLIPLGVAPPGFASVDYVPLVPWAGFMFIGVWVGNLLYPATGTRPWLAEPESVPFRLVALAGRRSLLVYFVHQPLLLGSIWLVLRLRRILG